MYSTANEKLFFVRALLNSHARFTRQFMHDFFASITSYLYEQNARTLRVLFLLFEVISLCNSNGVDEGNSKTIKNSLKTTYPGIMRMKAAVTAKLIARE